MRLCDNHNYLCSFEKKPKCFNETFLVLYCTYDESTTLPSCDCWHRYIHSGRPGNLKKVVIVEVGRGYFWGGGGYNWSRIRPGRDWEYSLFCCILTRFQAKHPCIGLPDLHQLNNWSKSKKPCSHAFISM